MTRTTEGRPGTTTERTVPARWVTSGPVVVGHRRGRQLGWPTANVQVPPDDLPPPGVFAAWVDLPGEDAPWPAAVSVGDNPTFDDGGYTVEAHLVDWTGDLYGRHVTVRAQHRLRDNRAFAGLTELVAAIEADVARTRTLLTGAPAPTEA